MAIPMESLPVQIILLATDLLVGAALFFQNATQRYSSYEMFLKFW